MPNLLRLDGVDELLAALVALAPDLVAEAAPLEASIAEATADELRAAYPMRTGRLRELVAVERLSERTSGRVATSVVSNAAHAPYVEFGTRYMAPRPTFIPITRRGRERFVQAVIDKVRDQGLVVSGGLGG